VNNLRDLAWKPTSAVEVADEANASGRRPAREGERFVLTIHRNPGSHTRPSKRGGKPVRVPGMSINDWMGRAPQIRANLATELVRLVAEEADAQGCPSFHGCKPYVRVTYFYKDKRGRDWMNTGKQLLDAFEVDVDKGKAGIILNDSDKHILLDRPRIVEGDANPRVEVTFIDTRGMTSDEVADLFRESALEQVRRLIG
jgi:hypothetical protein